MLTLIFEKTRRELGILDPEAPVFQVKVVFKNKVPEVTMIPRDNEHFTEMFSKTILSGGFVPAEGTFIYEICFGEQSRIISDDQGIARMILKRFGHLLMEPIEIFTHMLASMPKRAFFEEMVKEAMQAALYAAARSGQIFDFDWEISCCDRIQAYHSTTDGNKEKMVISISGIKNDHPFFSIFIALTAEAVATVVEANKRKILADFIGSIVIPTNDLEMFN